jgi:hypothetical protein
MTMMSFALSLLSLLLSRSAAPEPSCRRRGRSILSRPSHVANRSLSGRSLTARPRVEVLEDRTLLSPYLVTTTADSGTGSLRDAIIAINNDTAGNQYLGSHGIDEIDFSILWNDSGHVYYRGQVDPADVTQVPLSATSDGDLSNPAVVGAGNTAAPAWPHSWWRIQPQSALPTINAPVFINGYYQSGASCNTRLNDDTAVLTIELNGRGPSPVNGNGLTIVGGNSTVRGLVINGFHNYDGIALLGLGGDRVQGNFIGTDVSGSLAPYGLPNFSTLIGSTSDLFTGVSVNESSGLQQDYIGTDGQGAVPADPASWSDLAERNIISANGGGVVFHGPGVTDPSQFVPVGTNNVVAGNFIGTDAHGTTALGNWAGVGFDLGAHYDLVGTDGSGDVSGERNVISGNNFGVAPAGGLMLASYSCTIAGNFIGADVNGNPLGNLWVGVGESVGSLSDRIGGPSAVLGNTIAYNGENAPSLHYDLAASGTPLATAPGVWIAFFRSTPENITVQGNSIHDNAGLGIDLGGSYPPAVPAGVTQNDSAGHTGPNRGQNFPVLTAASSSATSTVVTGTFSEAAEPNTTLTLDFYANPVADPSGYGQGQTYLGSTTVTTDASGNASFTASGLAALPPGWDYLSATATNLATGDTSEFSQDLDLLLTNPTVTPLGSFTAVGFTLRNLAALSYSIDWGDGAGPQPIPAGQSSVSHVYSTTGIYSVQATAQNQGAAPPARALVVISGTAFDNITVRGTSAGQVSISTSDEGNPPPLTGLDQILVAGSSGSTTYAVNFGSTLITPITLAGTGNDTLIVNGVASSDPNYINKTSGQITWGSPVTETVHWTNIPNQTINANGTGQNYVIDPGGNTIINGGPGTNTITITATTGSGVVINGGPHANTYIIDMGSLLGPVTINSTAGTSTVTVNAPTGSNVLTLSPTQLTGDGETINFNLGSTATQFTLSGGTGNNNQLVVLGSPPGPLAAQNLAPTVGAITAPLAPTAVNVAIAASAGFTNLDGNSQTAVWNWGDGTTSPGSVSQAGTTGTVTGSHSYSTDGVFTITLTVTDSTGGGATTSVFQYAVIYNPSAGFVTGGGWFTSPAGAYLANPTLTGPANFGLNARYHSGATVPTGNTDLEFPAASLTFNSTGYDWLVISGSQAQYQGSGTLNGAGSYGFLVTAQDNGGHGADLIRIQIWDRSHGNAVVYDTQPGAPTSAAPTTPLGGGRIQVHTGASIAATGGTPGGTSDAPPAPSGPGTALPADPAPSLLLAPIGSAPSVAASGSRGQTVSQPIGQAMFATPPVGAYTEQTPPPALPRSRSTVVADWLFADLVSGGLADTLAADVQLVPSA